MTQPRRSTIFGDKIPKIETSLFDPPLGYSYDEKGNLVPDENAENVRTAFNFYFDLCQILDKYDIPAGDLPTTWTAQAMRRLEREGKLVVKDSGCPHTAPLQRADPPREIKISEESAEPLEKVWDDTFQKRVDKIRKDMRMQSFVGVLPSYLPAERGHSAPIE